MLRNRQPKPIVLVRIHRIHMNHARAKIQIAHKQHPSEGTRRARNGRRRQIKLFFRGIAVKGIIVRVKRDLVEIYSHVKLVLRIIAIDMNAVFIAHYRHRHLAMLIRILVPR